MQSISKKKLVLIIVIALITLLIAGFSIYVSDYYRADNAALTALNSRMSYNVSNTADFITFTPIKNKSTMGIIFYPGAKVQAESYSVVASKLAEEGYLTVIVKMPFNLAFFGVNKADDVVAQHPEIKSWVMIGHSLGGVFASEYALNHQDKIKGVVYLASYPSSNASNATFKGLSISGSLDGIINDDIAQNKVNFPLNTTFITINGGNHYNFGNYGIQEGDNNSTITREEQQNLTISHIIDFIQTL